jgi:hypothetical protein
VSEEQIAGPVPSRLPVWPLLLMFGLTPLWWVLGAFYLCWPLFGAVLLLLLITRGRIVLPPATGWWVAFLALAALSATQVIRPAELMTLGLRFAFYLTALLVLLYAYTAAREGTSWGRLLAPLCMFWLAIIVLGWIGVLAPTFEASTLMEALLPAGLRVTPFLNDMVHLHAAEYNPLSLHPTFRPSAPFPYTNNWGSTYALLLPCVAGYIATGRRGPLRPILMVSLPLSLPPAYLTLNRGMFISLGAGLALLAARALWRGNARVVLSIVALTVLGWLASLLIPVGELISERVETSATTTDRMGLYREVLAQVVSSPLLGFGAPHRVDTTSAQVPVGTQGQLWMVLFSHGIPALICFLGWFVLVSGRLGRARSVVGQWLAVVPVIALIQVPFYGLTYQNLSVVMLAAGVAMAAIGGAVNRAEQRLTPGLATLRHEVGA